MGGQRGLAVVLSREGSGGPNTVPGSGNAGLGQAIVRSSAGSGLTTGIRSIRAASGRKTKIERLESIRGAATANAGGDRSAAGCRGAGPAHAARTVEMQRARVGMALISALPCTGAA